MARIKDRGAATYAHKKTRHLQKVVWPASHGHMEIGRMIAYPPPDAITKSAICAAIVDDDTYSIATEGGAS